MEKVRKQKTHKLTEEHPVVSAILFAFAGMIVFSILHTLINMPLNTLIPAYPKEEGLIGALAAEAVLLLYYYQHFKPEFEGQLRGGRLKAGFPLILFHAVYVVLVSILGFASGAVLHTPTLISVSAAFIAGTMEEIVFRGYLVSTLMRQWKRDESKILPAAIISGVVFGLVHITNVLAGAPLGITIFQTIVVMFAGVFLAAVYLRTGNLLPVMVAHFAQDFFAYVISDPDSNENLVMSGAVTWDAWVDGALLLALAGVGIWLIRPAKRGEILEIWQNKWTELGGTQNVQEGSQQ